MPFVILDSNYVTIFQNLSWLLLKWHYYRLNFLMECLINVVLKPFGISWSLILDDLSYGEVGKASEVGCAKRVH
jgi:hypothetical protein